MSTPELFFRLPTDSDAAENRGDQGSDTAVVVREIRGDSDGVSVFQQDGSADDNLTAIAKLVGAGTKGGSLTRVASDGISYAVVALDARIDRREALRQAAGVVTRTVEANEVRFELPAADADDALAIAEGALLGTYRFTEFRSQPAKAAVEAIKDDAEKKPTQLSRIVVMTDAEPSNEAVSELHAAISGVFLTRDLVNTPPRELSPEELARRASEAAGGVADVAVTVWDFDELQEQGFGGIAGVGQGSDRTPRLVRVAYTPAEARQHIAFVGKGITYDSGGYSLKPAQSMRNMKTDMAGAATVLAATIAAAKVKAKTRVTAWLCIAENMVSGASIRPDDVLRIYGGKTVEVTNTDAEGRLVMADGIARASEDHPDEIIDVATLTGAQIVALGNRFSGLMSNDEALSTALVEDAAETGELMWRMPLPVELEENLRSEVADMVNAKLGAPAGGMLFAGIFLREFVGQQQGSDRQIPWAHIDIAGPSFNTGSAYGYTPAGASGAIVRTLLTHITRAGSR